MHANTVVLERRADLHTRPAVPHDGRRGRQPAAEHAVVQLVEDLARELHLRAGRGGGGQGGVRGRQGRAPAMVAGSRTSSRRTAAQLTPRPAFGVAAASSGREALGSGRRCEGGLRRGVVVRSR